MFNYFYKRYKVEVLNTSLWMSVKELKLYEKVFLTIVVLGAILSGIFSMLDIKIGLEISVVLILIGLVLLMIVRNGKPEQKRIVEEIIGPSANDRMQEMIKLLISFEIDVTDEKQLGNLIKQARKQQEAYDVWKRFRQAFRGMTTYVLLPIVTILLSEFFKGVNLEILLYRAVILVLICACIVLLVAAFALNFNDIFNPDIRNLEYLICDIEDVMVFANKTQTIRDIYKS